MYSNKTKFGVQPNLDEIVMLKMLVLQQCMDDLIPIWKNKLPIGFPLGNFLVFKEDA